ncbi:U-box domain-containing protein 4 [Acorus gramineus]|uniref:RING-type E3 ubiquitin transferase n=1 Tax=Acorus gramineus TaxID=55184 RepID=A0AAV9A8R9_ACOGR|nr:U-box domain-containing protein 4 [Acorus gramineus]
MEISLLKALLNSISQFSLLSSGNNSKTELLQRYYQTIDDILSLLRPVLYGIMDSEIALDEQLKVALEELDVIINEAMEIVESWHQRTSKVYFVLRIESIISKLQILALETCRLLSSMFQLLNIDYNASAIEECNKKIQHISSDNLSDVIRQAMEDAEKATPNSACLAKTAASLSLTSNQELLMEAVALDKLKSEVGHDENNGEAKFVDQMIGLVAYMHGCHVKEKQLQSINDVPIPCDFCCPLSLDLMTDPVIVASGQTYERAYIRGWLDLGLTVCPKTRQTLGHVNLIPNYTVKALIVNWCETNEIKRPDPVKPSTFLGGDPVPRHSGYSFQTNCPRSPESTLQEVPSHHHSGSDGAGSPLRLMNGFESNMARLPMPSSDVKEASVSSRKEFSEASTAGDQAQGHSRSVSASSAVSSNDFLNGGEEDSNGVSRVSSDFAQYSSDHSGEVKHLDGATSSAPQREPEFPPKLSEARSRSHTIWRRPSERFVPRIVSSLSIDTRADLLGVETQVKKLVEELQSSSVETKREATGELRSLARHTMENRIIIANCGAISHLVELLHSMDLKTQENAVTALLNLSINDNNKTAIANADAIEPLIHVLQTGNAEARENSAATLFSLSKMEENKLKIGRSGAIIPLVELLGSGTPRGKKDAATALFNLSISHENKARIVQAGAVRHLVELMEPAAGMVDKAVAVLANLATIQEGRNTIGHEGGIPVLVEVVELGSARGKENAAAALLYLCMNSNRFCSMVLQEGAVPPLVALSQSGTPRAKEKAQQLLRYFRNQRHGNPGRS